VDIYERVLLSYTCLNGQIKQMSIRSKAKRVQNEGMKRSSYGNRKSKHGIGFYKQRLIIGLMLDYR